MDDPHRPDVEDKKDLRQHTRRFNSTESKNRHNQKMVTESRSVVVCGEAVDWEGVMKELSG